MKSFKQRLLVSMDYCVVIFAMLTLVFLVPVCLLLWYPTWLLTGDSVWKWWQQHVAVVIRFLVSIED